MILLCFVLLLFSGVVVTQRNLFAPNKEIMGNGLQTLTHGERVSGFLLFRVTRNVYIGKPCHQT